MSGKYKKLLNEYDSEILTDVDGVTIVVINNRFSEKEATELFEKMIKELDINIDDYIIQEDGLENIVYRDKEFHTSEDVWHLNTRKITKYNSN